MYKIPYYEENVSKKLNGAGGGCVIIADRYYKEWSRLKTNDKIHAEFSKEMDSTTEVKANYNKSIYQEFQELFSNIADLATMNFTHLEVKIFYFEYLVKKEILNDRLRELRDLSKDGLITYLNTSSFKLFSNIHEIEESIFQGNVVLFY
jgi:hypothetical protein